MATYRQNMLEKAMAVVAPRAAMRHFESRIRLNEFSEFARTGLRGGSGGAASHGAPETHVTNRSRVDSMWDARDLEMRSPLLAGVIKRLSQYVVGKLKYESETGNPSVNSEYDDYFEAWTKKSDHTGRMSFRQQVEILFRSTIRDGDHGFNIVDSDDMREVRLQNIESDRIGSPHDSRLNENHVAGINIENGRPKSYDIYKRSHTGQYTKDREVEAGAFIHFLIPRRADEYRGRTILEPSLTSVRDLLEIFGFEKQAMKFSAQWAAFVTMADPNGPSAFSWDKKDPKTGWGMADAMPGKIAKLGQGDRIDIAQGVSRPNQAFLNLVELTIQMIALSLDLPFGFVFDMSKLGGVTARIESQLAKRTIQGFQTRLTDSVLDRVKNEVLMRGIMYREIPPHPNWKSGRWHFGAHITSDVQHQVNADLQLIEAGLKSERDWCEENDVDFDRTQEALADAVNLRLQVAESRQIPPELPFRSMGSATESLAAYRSKDDPPAAGGLVEEVGESGSRPLMQVVEAYHEGTVDRESAIAQLIELYDFDPEKAAMFFPEKPEVPRILR